MRLARGYLILGLFIVLVLGALFGLAQQKRVGFTPLKVGEPRQKPTHRTEIANLPAIGEKSSFGEEDQQNHSHDGPIPSESNSQKETAFEMDFITIAELQTEADRAIAEARYEHALHYLKDIARLNKDSPDARIQFKLAACQEILGDQYSALKSYRTAMNSTHSQPLLSAARLGQCRIWAKQEKAESARNELYSMLLSHRESDSRHIAERVFNQLALSSTESLLQESPTLPVLSDQYLYLPTHEISIEEIVSEIAGSTTNRSTSIKESAIVQNVLKLDENPDSIIFDLASSPLSVRQLLTELCRASGLKLSFKDEISDRIDSVKVTPSFQGLPFSIVLDALLVPLQLNWTQEGDSIFISNREQSADHRSAESTRLLKFAISASPDHSLTQHCRLALAILKHLQGDLQEAIHEYERILSQSSGHPFASEIWMNIGKCRLQLKQADAIDAFYSAIDAGIGHSVEAAAHAYVGRIHLAQNNPERAHGPLFRAEEIAIDPQLLTDIRLLQAASFLLDSDAEEGLKRLNLCARTQKNSIQQNQFSVLVMLVKNELKQNEVIREKDAAILLSGLTNLHDQVLFGEHWSYLQARAYHELGFQKETNRIIERVQQASPDLPITIRTLDFSNEKISSPSYVFSATTEYSPASDTAFIRYCQIRLQADDLSSAERVQTLRKLGAAYQRQGQHLLAIQCFTNSYTPTE